MYITIKYFGQLAEVTQRGEETLMFSGNSIVALLDILYARYEGLENKDFQVAQNQKLVSIDTKLTGDEIALLPPFSGG